VRGHGESLGVLAVVGDLTAGELRGLPPLRLLCCEEEGMAGK